MVHKVGTLDGTENDSAYVVDGPIAYVLSVSVDGLDEAAGWWVIAQISARVWQYEVGRPAFVAPVVVTTSAPPPSLNRH